ncbi:G-protein coupled receptor 54-like [Amphiura filiformis]|uniref:G-protein coupled receptor 54-like n=1 Tax=Amphiura filiformis TaxID=82378 RepID=UPI003B22014B
MTDTSLSTTSFVTSATTEIVVDNFTVWDNITTDTPPLFPPIFGPRPRPPLTLEDWLVPLVLSIVTLIGVVGNSVVIYVVFKNGKMHTVTNFYIVNLAATDISFLIFVVPPTASTYATLNGSWIWGSFLCKFVNYMQMVTAQATCLTLTAMSVDRYQAIVHPLKSLRTRTTKLAAIISASIWTFSILVSTPMAIYRKQYTFGTISFCWENWPRHLRQILFQGVVVYTFIVIYVIPLTIICVCYSSMLIKLWVQVVPDAVTNAQAQERQTRQKRKITYMILVVVIVFTVCWMPFHVINLWIRVGGNYPRTKAATSMVTFARCLAYANSCLNPFIYAFMGENFRKYFRKAFPCCYSNKVGPDVSSGEGRSVVQERTAGANGGRTVTENVPPA